MTKFLLFVMGGLIFFACDNVNQRSAKRHWTEKYREPHYQKKNFDSLVNVTEKGLRAITGGLDRYEELLTFEAFNEIFEHSNAYFSDVPKLLARQKITGNQLIICIMAMQNIDPDNYCKLCDIYFKLFQAHKISEGMLETCIMPNFLSKHIIAKNYESPAIAAILTKILKNNLLSKDFRKLLNDTLSGAVWRGIKSGAES